MTDTNVSGGQVGADSSGATATAPAGNEGISGSSAQTTASGPDAGATTESFYDPKSIEHSPELQLLAKQLQGSYTKRMQEMATHRPKIEAYDRFSKDPMGTMRELAQQYGWQLVQAGDKQNPNEPWNPQSWDDVMVKAKQEVLKEMRPVFDEVKSLKKQNVESYLDSHYSDWRTYEDAMMTKLQAHPSLVSDPDSLYRLAVPSEVWEARATKAAMKKLQATQDNAQVSGGTTTKQTTTKPSGPMTFSQSVENAKRVLAEKGIRGLAG